LLLGDEIRDVSHQPVLRAISSVTGCAVLQNLVEICTFLKNKPA
jgi:hypothetical protein